jgi:hypothetical protein
MARAHRDPATGTFGKIGAREIPRLPHCIDNRFKLQNPSHGSVLSIQLSAWTACLGGRDYSRMSCLCAVQRCLLLHWSLCVCECLPFHLDCATKVMIISPDPFLLFQSWPHRHFISNFFLWRCPCGSSLPRAPGGSLDGQIEPSGWLMSRYSASRLVALYPIASPNPCSAAHSPKPGGHVKPSRTPRLCSNMVLGNPPKSRDVASRIARWRTARTCG